MYLWQLVRISSLFHSRFNYLENGEDDVRAIHCGCSASSEYKMLGALFLRDGSGPFKEHGSFWHPLHPRASQAEELQRQAEILAVQSFRFDHIPVLFNLERQAVFELYGGEEAVRLARFHQDYAGRLDQGQAESVLKEQYEGMIESYGFQAELQWSQSALDGVLF